MPITSGTFEDVVRARVAAVNAETPEVRARAEGQLTDALRRLFAVAESYPELKASDNFQSPQQSLGKIEDDVQSARRYYNAAVRDLNTAVDTFPSNQIARFFRFAKGTYFELDTPADRQVPRVAFPGRSSGPICFVGAQDAEENSSASVARIFDTDWRLNLRLLSEVRQDYDNVFPLIRDEMYGPW